MFSCPRNIKTVLSIESDIKIYDKYINKTKEIILGHGAYQHTKTEFFFKLSFLVPSWEILSGHVYLPRQEQNMKINVCDPE